MILQVCENKNRSKARAADGETAKTRVPAIQRGNKRAMAELIKQRQRKPLQERGNVNHYAKWKRSDSKLHVQEAEVSGLAGRL